MPSFYLLLPLLHIFQPLRIPIVGIMVKGHTIDVETAYGPFKFNYFISTPTQQLAEAVDPSLPTLLLLHGMYLASVVFHPQFSEPSLRRYNLVSVDLPSHGETDAEIPGVFTQEDQARVLSDFMDAVKLPSCYIVGLSMGTIIGLQLAILFPNKVSGLFLVSPLATAESEDVKDGRRQIADAWKEAFVDGSIDEETMVYCISGALELAFNGESSNMVTTLVQVTLPEALRHWGPANFDDYETTTIKVFTERRNYDISTLARLANIPIALVHCREDIAFPQAYMDVFTAQLAEAGVDFSVHDVPGAPHFGSITHSNVVNPILARFVASHWHGPEPPSTKLSQKFTTPFEEHMRKVGWKGGREDSDSEDED